MTINPYAVAEGARVGDGSIPAPGADHSRTEQTLVTREHASFEPGRVEPSIRLEALEIHLWQRPLRLESTEEDLLHGFLSPDEQQRAQRLHSGRDRRAFVAVRGTLRALLGHYLQQPPATLRFCYNPDGKPFLEGSGPAPAFNVTHSGEWGLFAITLGTNVGIDLERLRPITPERCLRLARRFFSGTEVEALARLPEGAVNAAFFACWTRKEAYIKCRGAALTRLLAHCSVNVDPDEPASLLATPWQPEDQSGCQLHDLPAPEGYRAALALASPAPFTLCHHPWREEG